MSTPENRAVSAAQQAVIDAERALIDAKYAREKAFREDLAILCNTYGLTIEASGTEGARLQIVELCYRTARADDFE